MTEQEADEANEKDIDVGKCSDLFCFDCHGDFGGV